MNSTTSHQHLKDLIPAAALEILDDAEAREVSLHLQDCCECARLLSEYRQTAALLPELLPDQLLEAERSAAIRTRLMHRVHSQHERLARDTAAVTPATPESRIRSDRWTAWIGWAVAAGLAGILLVHHSVHRPVDYGWLAAGGLTFVVLALAVYALKQRARLNQLRDQTKAHR